MSATPTDLELSYHQFQHAYFAAPRLKRGGRIVGMPAGLVPLVMSTMTSILGYRPNSWVGDTDCRTCKELGHGTPGAA